MSKKIQNVLSLVIVMSTLVFVGCPSSFASVGDDAGQAARAVASLAVPGIAADAVTVGAAPLVLASLMDPVAAEKSAPTDIYVDQANGHNTSATAGTAGDPFKSITYAMATMASRNTPDPWIVHIKAGTYDANPAKPDNEREPFPINLREGITMQGDDGAANCVISGAFNPNSAAAILRATSLQQITLKDLTLSQMYRTSGNGGACELNGTGATIQGCVFSNNSSTDGAVWLSLATNTTCQLSDSTFSANVAFNNSVGAGFCVSGTFTGAISGCTFTGNSANNAGGGGIYAGTFMGNISDCAFSGNSCNGAGGGLYVPGAFTGDLTGCTFSGNSSSGSSGGGFYVGGGFTGDISDCTFSGNHNWSYAQGGGFYISGGLTGNILGCTFAGNSTYWGYGGFCVTGTLTGDISGSVFTSNSTTYNGGGGFYVGGLTGDISGCTFSGNVAANNYGGGGLIVAGQLQGSITRNVFCNNTAAWGGALYLASQGGPVIGLMNNLFLFNQSPGLQGASIYSSQNVDVVNNTFYNGAAGQSIVNITHYAPQSLILNNLFSHVDTAIWEESDMAFCVNYNDFDTVADIMYRNSNVLGNDVAFLSLALPCFQNNQDGAAGFAGLNSFSGAWTADPVYDPASNTTTLTDGTQGWAANSLAGMLVNATPTQANPTYFPIVSNTATLVVRGNLVATGLFGAGDNYIIDDYHLAASSSNVDTGGPGGATEDFDGNPRPVGAGWDIGAFELGGGLPFPGGSLSVTISPAAAVAAGAQWSFNGGLTWNGSGATINNVPASALTISFNNVSGWTRPANQSVTVTVGATATATGTYIPLPTGGLKVTILPAMADPAWAQWSIDGGATWNNSGATLNNVPVGPVTVTFSGVTGWQAPGNQIVTVTGGGIATASGTYVPLATGSLEVTIQPVAVVAAIAQWSIDGGATWNNSGATLNNIPAGPVTVTFTDITGWSKPADQTVTITASGTASLTGTYTASPTGGLEVAIQPASAVPGAQWSIDGGTTWNNSGVTFVNLPTGSVTIAFNGVAGWTTPPSQMVTITAGQMITVIGTYIAQPTDVFVDQANGHNDPATAGTAADPFKAITYAMAMTRNRNTPDPWVVHVKAGTYDANPAKPDNEREIFPIDLREGITMQGEDGVANCIISGVFNPNSSAAILRAANLQQITLNDLTLTQMDRTSGNGGACEINGPGTTIQGCVFSNNSGTNGAVWLSLANNATCQLSDSTFNGNVTLNNTPGGGFCVSGTFTGAISGCTFSGNSANNSSGGGIYAGGFAGNISDCTFSGNGSNGSGGGLYVPGAFTGDLTGCTFTGNSSSGSSGGGFYVGSGMTGDISDCTFSGNHNWSYAQGGGFYVSGGLTGNISACTFTGNSTYWGYGGFCVSGTLTGNISGCVFTGNSATYNGGGGFYAGGLTGDISGCTFSGNVAANNYGGGGFLLNGLLNGSINRNVFGYNTAAWGGAVYLASQGGPVVGLMNNLFLFNQSPGLQGASIYTNQNVDVINNTFYNGAAGQSAVNITHYAPQSLIYNNIFSNVDTAIWEETALALCVNYNDFDNVADIMYRNSNALGNDVSFLSLTLPCFEHNQDWAAGFAGLDSFSGAWTAAPVYDPASNTTTLTDGTQGWAAVSLAGMLVNATPAPANPTYFPIISNTATQLVVQGNLVATGLFVVGDDYIMDDYHLAAGSSNVDAGGPGGPLDDFDGKPRPLGAGWDIGAFELGVPAGNLNVTILPPAAVTAGAQWSFNGGLTWNGGGAAINSLPAGTYTVSFNDISGWTAPASQTVTITTGGTATATGTYVPLATGSVTATIQPVAAVLAGAQWSIDGGATWNNSAATVNNVPDGPVTVTFSSVTGWQAPGNQMVTVAGGGTATASGTYIPLATGSLEVTIEPVAAVAAVAQWSIDGGATWNNSGATLNNVPAGPVTVTFTDITGWLKPADQIVTVTASATATATGTYTTSNTGGLQVAILPATVGAGAQWSIDGGVTWNNNLKTFVNLPAGNVTIAFSGVAGWVTPASQTVEITAGQMTIATGTYVLQPTDVFVDQANGHNASTTAGTAGDPFKSITYAMLEMESRNTPDPWVVHIKAGTYDADPAKAGNEREIFPVDMREGITVQGEDGAANCVISGAFNANSSAALFRAANLDQFMLKDLTLTQMTRTSGNGAACEINGSGATIQGCVFSNNTGPNGAVWLSLATNTSCQLSDSMFSGNVTSNNTPGGGFCVSGTFTGAISGCTFSGNSAINNGGGGLYAGAFAGNISDCAFSANGSNGNGGSLYVQGAFTGDISGCTFSGNSSSGSNGGGFYVGGGLTGDISACTFSGNHNWSYAQGGGFYINGGLTGNVLGCTFSGNSTYWGYGGFCVTSTLAGNVSGCIFSGNSATYNGGGGFYAGGLTGDISDCTFTGNTVANNYPGGGFYLNGLLQGSIKRNVFCYNTAAWGGALYLASQGGPVIGLANNLFLSNQSPGLNGASIYSNQNVDVVNNTFYGGATGQSVVNITHYAPQSQILNNLFSHVDTAIWEETELAFCVNDNDFDNVADIMYRNTIAFGNDIFFIGLALPCFENNQDWAAGFAGLNSFRGAWTADAAYDPASNTTTLTDKTQNWSEGSLLGMLVNATPAPANPSYFPIVNNNTTTLVVRGNLAVTGLFNSGDTYTIDDYHLAASSSNVDTGGPGGASEDFDGKPRPLGAGWDIGAFEMGGLPAGSLSVTILPPAAVTAGALWSFNGGVSWNGSGATINKLPAGTFTVSFNNVSGWTTPASQTAAVTTGGNATATGTYIPLPTGGLTVTIQPASAVSAGAQWSIDGGATWNNSGAALNNVPVGPVTVAFSGVTGWQAPNSQIVTVAGGATAAASGTYIPLAIGSLEITILPVAAVSAVAQWSIDGGATWNNSGATVNNIPAGPVTVTFTDITGWAKPADQTVTITTGATLSLTETYATSRTGGLEVTIEPASVGVGAQWSIDGGTTWNGNGATLVNIPVGNVTIAFSGVTGWATPPNQTVAITPGLMTTVIGTYIAQPTDIFVDQANGHNVPTTAGTAADPFKSITYAMLVMRSRNTPDPWLVHIKAGMYDANPAKAGNEREIFPIDLREEITMQGEDGVANCVISGAFNANSSAALLRATSLPNVTLNDLTLTQMDRTSGNGAACELNSSGATIQGCVVSNNSSANGAVWLSLAINTTCQVSDSTFSDNVALNNTPGGAFYVSGTFTGALSGCTFIGNSANNGGGAIYAGAFAGNISDCAFSANSSNGNGGTLYVPGAFTGDISGCTFSGNSSSGSNGGGFYIGGGLTGDISDCTFTGNHNWSYAQGGGFYVSGGLTGNISGCTFSANSTYWGYGGFCVTGALTGNVAGCTFTGNSATYNGGGGFYVGALTGDISGCTFSANAAANNYGGGGGYIAGQLQGSIKRNVFCYNTAAWGGALYLANQGGAVVLVANNLFLFNQSPGLQGASIYSNQNVEIVNNTFNGGASGQSIVNITHYAPQSLIYNNIFSDLDTAIWEETELPFCVNYNDFDAVADIMYRNSNALGNDVSFLALTLPCFQNNQEWAAGFAGLNDFSGAWTADPVYDPASNTTTLTDGTQGWTAGALVGMLVNATPAPANPTYFPILNNTPTQLVVLGNLAATTLFTSGRGYIVDDYHLSPVSGNVDTGGPGGATEDFDGKPRPLGAAWDIGAFELGIPAGSLNVTILPPAAVTAGAQWSFNGGLTWYGSGVTINNLPAGNLTVSFRNLSGWTTPASQAVTITTMGGTATATGTYASLAAGSVTATIEPVQAVLAGAQWTIDGGATWNNSGVTLNNVPAGIVTVMFSGVTGWLAPGSEGVVVAPGGTASATGVYSLLQYTLMYTAGANGTISGAFPQIVNYGASGTAVTAVPNVGYRFVQWNDGSAANPRTDTNVTANVNVTAAFAVNNTYTLSLSVASGDGTLTAAQSAPYSYGEVVQLIATAGPGYRVKTWTGTDSDASTASTNTVTMNGDKTVTVVFAEIVPIAIDSVVTLQKIGNDPGYPLDGYYVVTQDIDASATATWNSGAGFVPLGNGATPFTGTFDGQGYMISGLAINRPTQDYVGLFGQLRGQVEHLGLEGGAIAGSGNVGNMAGGINGGSITECHATGAISGLGQVGGLAGANNGGALTHCYAMCSVSGGQETGGLIGYNAGSIVQCYSTSVVLGHNFMTGGLAGYNAGSIFECYATGAVFGSNFMTGGFAGYNAGSIVQCYSTGAVLGSSEAGGLIGDGSGGTTTDSYWDTEASGLASSAGGTGETTAEMMSQATFVNWDFAAVWGIAEGQTYPWLRFFGPRYGLALAVNPAGVGTIKATPSGPLYAPGTVVMLVATANAGYSFDHWSGDTVGIPDVMANTASITMDSNKSLTANFVAQQQQQFTLTTMAAPSTAGMVQPAFGTYAAGTVVNLLAVPMNNYMFVNWTGDVAGIPDVTNPSISVVMDQNRFLTAHFLPLYTLTTAASPANAGRVIPSGITTYPAGATVTLTAIPSPVAAFVFANWTGTITVPPTATITITMTGDIELTANFTLVAYNMLTTSVVGSGGTLSPPTGPQVAGSVVQLTATPDAGYQVKQWAGTDNDAATTPANTVTMTGDKTVTVEFEAIVQNGTLNGTVTLEGRPPKPNARWIVALDVVVVPPAPVAAYETTITTDNTGAFALPDLTPGAYQFWVKAPNALAVTQSVSIVVGSNAVDFGTLPEGDANGDNDVSLVDFSILVAAFDTTTGRPGYDARADFNGDGSVTLVDFSMLNKHFGQVGAVKPPIGIKSVGNDSRPTTKSLDAPSVTMAVVPETLKAAVGQVFDVTLEVQTGDLAIDGAAACLEFDPAVLQIEAVQSAGKLPVPLANKTDNDTGKLTFAAGAFSSPPSGAIPLVTVTFKAVGASDGTPLTLANGDGCETAVTAKGVALPNATSDGVVIVDAK